MSVSTGKDTAFCDVLPLPFFAKTPPLPCVSTAKTAPLPCVCVFNSPTNPTTVLVCRVNCVAESSICDNMAIQSYPSLYWVSRFKHGLATTSNGPTHPDLVAKLRSTNMKMARITSDSCGDGAGPAGRVLRSGQPDRPRPRAGQRPGALTTARVPPLTLCPHSPFAPTAFHRHSSANCHRPLPRTAFTTAFHFPLPPPFATAFHRRSSAIHFPLPLPFTTAFTTAFP